MKRDLKNKLIFGVCSGLAKETQVGVVILRSIFVLATLLGFGLPILVYLVLAIVMPAE
jgi:phage shock protein C